MGRYNTAKSGGLSTKGSLTKVDWVDYVEWSCRMMKCAMLRLRSAQATHVMIRITKADKIKIQQINTNKPINQLI
jgi:hypothetical protein